MIANIKTSSADLTNRAKFHSWINIFIIQLRNDLYKILTSRLPYYTRNMYLSFVLFSQPSIYLSISGIDTMWHDVYHAEGDREVHFGFIWTSWGHQRGQVLVIMPLERQDYRETVPAYSSVVATFATIIAFCYES